MDRTNKNSIKNSKPRIRDEFREIFNQSPIGILFHDKEGVAVNANNSALKIMAISKLDDILGINLFDNPFIAEKKEKLLKEGIIRFQAPLDLDIIKELGFYYPTKKGVLFLDYTVSVTDSGYLVQIQDITERKIAEEVQRSRESFRALAENSPDLIIRLDKDLRYVYINSTVTEKTGQSPEYYIGKTYEEAGIPEKYATSWKEGNLKAFETGEIQHQEFEFPAINGLRFIESTIIPEFNVKGEINSLLVLSRDITERKKMEDALKESEEKYRELFDKANDMISLSEIKANGMPGNYIEVNDVGIKRLGYSREEFLNLSPIDMVAPDKRVEMPKNAAVMAEKGSVNFEIVNVTKDGKRIPVEINGHIINYKGRKAYLTVSRDITERKQAEKRLKESADEIYDLYNNAPCGYHSLDVNGNFLKVNQTELSWLGYKKEELIGKNFSELLTKESQKAFKKNFRMFLERGYVKDLEYELIRKDGSIFPIILSASTLKDEKGNFLLSRSILFDITEIKKAQDELQRSRESFRTLAENSPFAIRRLDRDLRFLYSNRGSSFTELSKEDFIGRTVDEIGMDEDTVERWKISSQKAFKTGEIQEEINEVPTPDGIITLKSIIVPEFNVKNETESIIIITQDITTLKNTEEELRRSKTSFKTLAENSPDIINRIDKEFKTVYINPAIIEISGKSPEYFIGKSMDKLGIPEEFTVPLEEKSIKAFKTGEIQEFETKMSTVKGLKTFYTFLAPEFDESGEVNTVFTVSHDITELKQAEKLLKETIRELERSNQELQQFAYVSSHDLQEPLRTIASFTQLLQRRYKGQLDSDADEFMEYTVEATIRMKEQIEGLLEYSRVGTKGGEFKPVDMNKILNQTIKSLDTSIKESDAKIEFDELPNVMGDADQLQRVFLNLISNAIKFRKPEEPLKIHISSKKEDNEYIFSVQDNGIGIEEQYSERIFTIFQRLHTRDVYKGTGIGLSIVKRIIERHGGRIWVESSFGEGSTFYFTIPILEN
jgi:PAS domain S-box-containing protein